MQRTIELFSFRSTRSTRPRLRRDAALAALPLSVMLCAAAAVSAPYADALPQDKAQQACINALNKGGAKVAATQGKENNSCLKNAGRGKELDAQACLTRDDRGKVAAAQAKTVGAETKKCTTPADFAATNAVTVNAAAVASETALLADVFGADLGASAVSSDRDQAKCQSSLLKETEKLSVANVKAFLACKKSGLKDGSIASAADIEACFDQVLADEKGKITKGLAKLRSALNKKCQGFDLVSLFPGLCAGSDPFEDCVARRVRCRTCEMLNGFDAVSRHCDTYDDELGSNSSCGQPLIVAETVVLPNSVQPPGTPGTVGVVVTNPKLITRFGSAGFSLNNSSYTRWRLAGPAQQPDAILILISGFGAGANNFRILAEDLIPKMATGSGTILEVWGFHRRSNQLEDREGALIAIAQSDAQIALDWYFGGELGLSLHPSLAAGPNRRAVFFNGSDDIPFLANWTIGMFARDIDVVVDAARAAALNANVFLGGHSAGTWFTAQYAATDFDLTGAGPADPGYAKLRGLVLLEGGGGTTAGDPLSNDTLDRIIAKYDGGLFGAVRDAAPRCVDGLTPCTIATEATDCSGQIPPKCTLPQSAYAALGGLNPRLTASAEPGAIQALKDPDRGLAILQVDQGSPGNSAVDVVPELGLLGLLPDATVHGLLGQFLDDDSIGAQINPAIATSLGAPGTGYRGRLNWQDIGEGVLPSSVLVDNGPAPTALPGDRWGVEREVVRMDRFGRTFITDGHNSTDWYYAWSGLTVTSAPGICGGSTCTAGNVGALCSVDDDCAQSISLDSSALSQGRGRRDIVNMTQAANVDIPVICFGGSNGLTPVGADYKPFADSIGVCTAASCDGSSPRVADPLNPSEAFPTFSGVAGGFEVYINEGYAHVDLIAAEDTAENLTLERLQAFLERNIQ